MIDYDYIERGDCLELMKDIPDASIDLIVTDPPYLMSYRTNRRKDKSHEFCSPIDGDNDPRLIENYIRECHRILKDDSAMYMFCNSNKVDYFKRELEKHFKVKNLIVWVKNNHTAGDLKAQFGKQYEFIFLVNKGRAHIRGKRITDIWSFDGVRGNAQVHQNQKPVELLEQCILKHSDEGDLIFDGFLGSGSTCVACVNTNRHYIGFELDEKYFDIACQRLDEAEKRNEKNEKSL